MQAPGPIVATVARGIKVYYLLATVEYYGKDAAKGAHYLCYFLPILLWMGIHGDCIGLIRFARDCDVAIAPASASLGGGHGALDRLVPVPVRNGIAVGITLADHGAQVEPVATAGVLLAVSGVVHRGGLACRSERHGCWLSRSVRRVHHGCRRPAAATGAASA